MTRRPRSPNFPAVDLETAIQLAIDLYNGVGKGQFTPIDAAKAWGYNTASGPVKVRIGALRQYGLIDGRRGKNAENPHLSMRGLTLALGNSNSSEYAEALREASVAPPLFYELRQTRPEAADGVLREFLVIHKNFTSDGAERFIDVYKSTIDQVRSLSEHDQEGISDDQPNDREPFTEHPTPRLDGLSSGDIFTVPLPQNGVIQLPSRMSSAEWGQMETILAAYKAMIVHDVAESRDFHTDD